MPQLGRRLRRHVERGRPRGTTSDRVFVSLRRGRSGDYDPLTRSGVDQLIRMLGEEAGLEKRVHPHLLRHSFATWALTRGMNRIQLAQIMGHSSLAMIQSVYTHLTPQDAYAAMEHIVRAEVWRNYTTYILGGWTTGRWSGTGPIASILPRTIPSAASPSPKSRRC